MARYTFNKTTSTVTQNCRTIEQKAPTDDSVRLLREMEKMSREQMVRLIPAVNQSLTASIVIEEPGMAHLTGPRVLVKFVLNQTERTFEFSPSRFKRQEENLHDFLEAFGKALAVSIVGTVIDDLEHGDREALSYAMGRV